MLSKKILIVSLLFFFVSAFGAPVSIETAEKVAKKHLERKKHGGKIKRARAYKTKTFTPYFIFEKESKGFILVSADNVAAPILGETDSGVFDKDSMPPALVWLLETYEKQIEQAAKSGKAQDSETKALWEQSMLDSEPLMAVSYPTQLLSTNWSQSEPYNLKTPLDGTSRSVTGCAATAMAQIMKYWQYPSRGTGTSDAYYTKTKNISVPSVNFNTPYDYANMLDSYPYTSSGTTVQREAVSTLMYHVGASIEMDYSSGGSGAFTKDIAPALTSYFGYDNSIRYIWSTNSSGISASDWKDLVIGQIENHSPVIYGGQDAIKGGHGFIIDGYDNSIDKFHLNWGWNGSYNGFFVLTALNPNTYQFNTEQEMIINIMPDKNGNAPSQIKVSSFAVSNTGTALNASIRAKMNYGADFSGKIGFAVMSGSTISMVLDSANYSISNTHTPKGSYTVNYKDANLSKKLLGADMPSGNLTLQVVTKRGAGAWTPVGETRSVTIGNATYTVTFNANGGTVTPTTGTTTINGTLASLPTPTRTGYTFNGWFTAATGGTQISTSTVFTANATIYARWAPITYTITYTLDGGTVETDNPASYTIETANFTLNNPTRTGYTFAGWTGANGTTPQTAVSVQQGSTGSKSYTANWTLITYDVTFNANGGTVTPTSGTVGLDGKLASLPTPTRTGYTFDGWFTAETGGTQVTINTVFSANTTIYARWTPITYTITYTLDGGTVVTANPASYTIETANFTLNNPTRTGYTFAGWTGANGTTPQTTVSVEQGSTGDKSYTANWTIITYDVTFNASGGTVTTASGTTDTDQKLNSLPEPTRTGYIFNGWFTAETGGTQVTINTVFSANTTIYARWTPQSQCNTSNSTLFACGTGTEADPYQISTPEQLQNLNQFLGQSYQNNYYILINDIDLTSYLSSTGAGYNSGAGWQPIGYDRGCFYGKFNGNGKKVSGLWINRPSAYYVGLFGDVYTGAEIRNIGVEINDAKGGVVGDLFVGGLVGSGGTISGSYYDKETSGRTDTGSGIGKTTAEMKTQITYEGWDFEGIWEISTGYPTLVWQNPNHFVNAIAAIPNQTWTGSHITPKPTSISFKGNNLTEGTDFEYATYDNNIQTGTATLRIVGKGSYYGQAKVVEFTIIAAACGTGFAGGDGTQSNPYKIANARNLDAVNNCLGDSYSSKYYELQNDIDLSSYIANTSAGWQPIGNNNNSSYYYYYYSFFGKFNGQNHKVSGLWINRPATSYVGLFGYAFRAEIKNVGVEIDDSKGGIVGNYFVGGLVGSNSSGTISDSYATGSVSGSSDVGGLVGENNGTISNSYAIGSVSGTGTVGGLVGRNNGTVSGSYYDKQTTGRTDTDKGIGKTTVEMKTKNTYDGWDKNIWFIVNGDYPILQWQLKNLEGAIISAIPSQPYIGSAIEPTFTLKLGETVLTKDTNYTVSYSNNRNVGTAKITITGKGNYIGSIEGNFTITPKSITLTVTSITATNKVYDGTTTAEVHGSVSISGEVTGDNLTIVKGNASFNDKNVGTNKPIAFEGFSLTGTDVGNYAITVHDPISITANITPKPVTITASANNKVYDGNTIATVGTTTINDKVEGDAVTVKAGAASFDDKNVGNDKPITFEGFTLSGTDASNYTLTAQPASAVANITAKPVTITGISASSKVYDGNTTATITGTPIISGKIEGDNVTVKQGTASFDNQNVGTGKTVTFSGFSLSGTDAGNYTLSAQPASVTANITQNTNTAGGGSTSGGGSSGSTSGGGSSGGGSSGGGSSGGGSSGGGGSSTPLLEITSTGNIVVHTTASAILLSNLPPNTKVEVYTIQGKQIYSTHSENSQILRIGVQTKGMYIVKVGTQTMRVAVR